MAFIQGQRADIVKRGDNLQPEGEFQKRPVQLEEAGHKLSNIRLCDVMKKLKSELEQSLRMQG